MLRRAVLRGVLVPEQQFCHWRAQCGWREACPVSAVPPLSPGPCTDFQWGQPRCSFWDPGPCKGKRETLLNQVRVVPSSCLV